ncbi:flagellar motor protein PomA [Photobacterium phosphoreum]|uniref:Flagellar motor protein PomA n=1 Tax=Photobacterium phosphoreum TaxID=659 RepID=A0A2T3K5D0_PHOPO|nr:flagellar motor protein PomA [Photobacterium phosphoreum]MCD9464972.1 flagellar motor protein PomA [Photobacterium phosphoreum]MCD9470689.1 flagellar motor protein PomA [Photobacterium phosphoreum]MCD9473190.1 flagellar motor protein PomA [Photobacterium phosphoreum]MCD9478284.1 flagellar motor protein PomA [Photobacterium phosphoreum]MCD9482288.1 flagellar motor protein PomA [Photobacterium phosphoreum]
MDLATLIGLFGAFAFILMAMLVGGDLVMFADTSSVFIVIGGSLFVVLMKYNVSQFFGAAKIAAKAFIFKTDKPDDLIAQIVTMADSARKGGFLALEEMEVENPFLRKGIDLLVDGHDADTVRMMLRKDIALTNERHEQGASIFSSLGDVAPAMGMIGTLIGLVAMLSNMDDPKSIGPAMAVALLTTLYGSILANMVALPIADKLMLRKNEERLNRLLILDGVLAIQEGQNPRVIDSYLKNYLHEKKRRLNFDE